MATWSAHVRQLSQRLLTAVRPIHFDDSLSWDSQIEHEFLARGGKELPGVDRDYYRLRRLTFDPQRKLEELQDIERDAWRRLGVENGAGRILTRQCREFAAQVRMLVYRGTSTFVQMSQRLLGSALSPQTATWLSTLDELERRFPAQSSSSRRMWHADEAASALCNRLHPHFPEWQSVPTKVLEGVGTESTFQCMHLTLWRGRMYTSDDLRFLEVHDGWVHLGTSYNAQRQPVCLFLACASARAAASQSGLARASAFATGAMSARRVQQLREEIEAVRMAESGADFCELYRFFLESGVDEREGYRRAQRTFRGSLPRGCGPLTLDVHAAEGLTAVWRWLKTEAALPGADALSLVFAGKTALEDLDALRELSACGWLVAPDFLPPVQFA